MKTSIQKTIQNILDTYDFAKSGLDMNGCSDEYFSLSLKLEYLFLKCVCEDDYEDLANYIIDYFGLKNFSDFIFEEVRYDLTQFFINLDKELNKEIYATIKN